MTLRSVAASPFGPMMAWVFPLLTAGRCRKAHAGPQVLMNTGDMKNAFLLARHQTYSAGWTRLRPMLVGGGDVEHPTDTPTPSMSPGGNRRHLQKAA